LNKDKRQKTLASQDLAFCTSKIGWFSFLPPLCYNSIMTIKDISTKIIPILKRQGVSKAALFGSVVRGGAKKKSDVDILIDFSEKKSLLDLVRLQFVLEDKLGRKVDLLTYGSVHPLLKDIILKEEKVIYEKRS